MISIYDLRIGRICAPAGPPPREDGAVHHVDSGRSALYTILAVLKETRGISEVFVNAYTTDVVHAVIRSLGLELRPLDIDPETLIARWTPPQHGRPFAFIQTGLFGLPAFDAAIMHEVRRLGGFFIEDCCNSLGTRIGVAEAGTLGDAAIFSHRVGKPLSVGGGMLRINMPELDEPVRAFLATCGSETARGWFTSRLRIMADHVAFSPLVLRWIARPLREVQKRTPGLRFLVRGGVVDTLTTVTRDSIRRLHPAHAALIARRRRDYGREVSVKREVGRRLLQLLDGLPLRCFDVGPGSGWNGLFFPVLLLEGDPDTLIAHLRRRGFDATRFHADVPLLSFPGLDRDAFAGTMTVVDRLVCLPSTTRMTGRERALADALREYSRR